LGGNFPSLTTRTDAAFYTKPPPGYEDPTDQKPDVVGVTVLVYKYSDTVQAKIENGVTLNADSLSVTASTSLVGVVAGISGSDAGDLGFNGVVAYNSIRNSTLAQIGSGATIVIGNDPVPGHSDVSTFISATDTSYLIGVAGALAQAEKLGFGGAVAYNDT